MDSYEQLQTDVFYLAGHKTDYAAAKARIEAFAAEATGLDAGRARWLRGGLLREMGSVREAMQEFQAAADLLQQDPKLLAACLLDCGFLANHTGDLPAAEAAAQRFFDLAEEHPEAQEFKEIMYGIVGDICYLRGDVVGAIEWYRKAIRQLEDPFGATLNGGERICTMALHWHSLARCYLDLGDLVRVRFAVEGVRQCKHRDLQGLAAFDEFQLALRIGALAQAEQWLAEADRLMRNVWNRQWILLGHIWLARARGDSDGARQYLERLHTEHEVVIYEIQTLLDAMDAKEGVQ